MLIKHVIEKPDGSITLQADLGPAEVKFCIEYALNSLYERGALPFLSEESVDANLVHEPPEMEQ